MENEMHEAGTLTGCSTCREAVYEPGWYQMLRRISGPGEDRQLHLVCDGTKQAEAATDDPWIHEAPLRVSTTYGF
jgi:hypothetical protein